MGTIHHAANTRPAMGHAPVAESPAVAAIKITETERTVLHWSALGKSSWEIAVIQGCTESAVNFHFCNIRRKFGVHSRHIAVLMAVQLRLIDPF